MKFLRPITFCLLPLALHAHGETEPSAATWQGEGELGFTSTSGNSDSKNLNAKLGIARTAGKWKHNATLQMIEAETDGDIVADSQVFTERSEYSYTEQSYLFLQLRYEDDEFSGYDYQGSISVGVGSRFLDSEKHKLDASIGPGYRRIKDSETRDTEEGAIITATLNYRYLISESTELGEAILVESGDDNTFTQAETSLKSRINKSLASKISYLVKHNSDVPPGIDKTDEIVTISLIYAF